MNAFASLMADDIRWHQPGHNPFSGTHQGKENVLRMIGGLIKHSGDTLQLSPNGAAMANGDLIACPFRLAGKSRRQKHRPAGLAAAGNARRQIRPGLAVYRRRSGGRRFPRLNAPPDSRPARLFSYINNVGWGLPHHPPFWPWAGRCAEAHPMPPRKLPCVPPVTPPRPHPL